MRKMDRTKKRNIIGSVVCFFLSMILGGLGIAVMMFREVYQARRYEFDVEKDDVIRYSVVGAVGYLCQIIIIILLLKGGAL